MNKNRYFNKNHGIGKFRFWIAFKLLFAWVIAMGATEQAYSQVTELDMTNIPMSFKNPTLSVNEGDNGLAKGSEYRYEDVATVGDIDIYARLTIVDVNKATISNIDDDTQNGTPERFQPQIKSGNNNGGYIFFRMDFFNSATHGPVNLKNYWLTGVDIDGAHGGKGNNKYDYREFVEISGFSDYTLDNSTELSVSTDKHTYRTRFTGMNRSLPNIKFDNTASFIANYSTPTNSIFFALGVTDESTDGRLFSVQIGQKVDDFSNPKTTQKDIPIAVDDYGTVDYSLSENQVAVDNVFGNDLLAGIPLSSDDVVLQKILSNTNDNYVHLITSNGNGENTAKVVVKAKTPPGDYYIIYEIQTKGGDKISDHATIYFTVRPIAPTANNDNASTDALNSVSINVLDNDEKGSGDIDPSTLKFVDGTAPDASTEGTFSINGDVVTFTPVSTFSGTTTIKYEICDENSLCAEATISVDVRQLPDAIDDTGVQVNTIEGGTAVSNVLDNDLFNGATLDIDDVNLTVVTEASHTGVALDPSTGKVDVEAGTPSGDYTIKYRICMKNNPNDCDDATVRVKVAEVGPIAYNDMATTNSGVPVVIDVVSNDQVGSGSLDPSTVVLEGAIPDEDTVGKFEIDGTTGAITFTPAVSFTGTATVLYRVSDENGLSDDAQITINVTELPVALDDEGIEVNSTQGGTVVENVLANDSFAGNAVTADDVTISLVTAAGNDGVKLDANTGNVTVDPGTPQGDYTLKYRICMKANPNDCDDATVTIKVAGPLTPPTANDDVASTNPTVPVEIDVLDNDEKGDGEIDKTKVEFVDGTAPDANSVGTFTVDETTGKVTFTSVEDFTGDATIDYKVFDEYGLSGQATITVTVTALPVANDDTGTPVNSTRGGIVVPTVLANDLFEGKVIKAEDVNITVVTPATEAVVKLNTTSGEVTVDPETPQGNYTLVYRICMKNSTGDCDEATVSVEVTAPLTGPTAADDKAGTDQYTPVEIDVLNNDIAGSGEIKLSTLKFVNGTAPNAQTEGSFEIDAETGMVTFTPVNTFEGTATIDYEICDEYDFCDEATISVVVTRPNQPTILDNTAITDQGVPVNINVINNDTPGSGSIDPTTVSFVDGTTPNVATEGTFTVNSESGLVTFTPVASFSGTVTIDYQVCDSKSQCGTATITVNVIGNDDEDGDGIVDNEDDYPDDPDRAFDTFYPAGGNGTLAFEDLWPGQGDYDFNDLVTDYRFRMVTDASNNIVEVFGSFEIKAFGAELHNGFGFQFANSSIKQSDLKVTGMQLTSGYINRGANGLENGQNKPTIILFDDCFDIMQPTGGVGVNTTPGVPYVMPETINIHIEFTGGNYKLNQLNIEKFNPFLIVNKDRGREVHLPDYEPTKLADESHFGQAQDDTKPATGKYYKTENNLPWAVNIYESFDYPKEQVDIVNVYKHFVEWATSDGEEFPDWYQDKEGYRDESLIY